ncbi:hypothetical protein ALC60_12636 [Trachymyrmex zeteki]|uniref:Uncharacterized protein n=1 Tax=Mycetomoellerius zeteki TaxID=64791 RepID=A0A151WKC4_9HYME|nr:hypothetical protein ALC60_12636 [Trachymyrmex zeteki]
MGCHPSYFMSGGVGGAGTPGGGAGGGGPYKSLAGEPYCGCGTDTGGGGGPYSWWIVSLERYRNRWSVTWLGRYILLTRCSDELQWRTVLRFW